MGLLTPADLPYEKPLQDTLVKISDNGEALELYFCDASGALQSDFWELSSEVTINVVNSGGSQMFRLSNDHVNVTSSIAIDVNKSSQYVRLWHYHDGTDFQTAIIGALDDRYLPACSQPFPASTYHLVHLQAQAVRIGWQSKFGKNVVSLLFDGGNTSRVSLPATGRAQVVLD